MSEGRIRHAYSTGEQTISLGNSQVQQSQTHTDGVVTAGKTTLAGLGEDNEGASDLLAKNQIEYQRSVELSDQLQLSNRADGQAHEIQRATGSKVRSLFANGG